MSMVERLAEKWDNGGPVHPQKKDGDLGVTYVAYGARAEARWWLNAIADEVRREAESALHGNKPPTFGEWRVRTPAYRAKMEVVDYLRNEAKP